MLRGLVGSLDQSRTGAARSQCVVTGKRRHGLISGRFGSIASSGVSLRAGGAEVLPSLTPGEEPRPSVTSSQNDTPFRRPHNTSRIAPDLIPSSGFVRLLLKSRTIRTLPVPSDPLAETVVFSTVFAAASPWRSRRKYIAGSDPPAATAPRKNARLLGSGPSERTSIARTQEDFTRRVC